MMRLRCAARTDLGLRRSINEDSVCVREDLGLFVVADGMGGHVGGEVASRLAVDELERFVDATTGINTDDTWPIPIDPAVGRNGNRLQVGFNVVNRCIADRVEGSLDLRGMATTAVALLVGEDVAALAHVGDSRAYRLRANQLTRLTRDHSWVEEQIRAGMLSPTAARTHPQRNIVTRALSGADDLKVDLSELRLEPGDELLLCSDGLSSVVADDEIGVVLGGAGTLDGMCEELIRRANNAGGPDNVTVLVIHAG